MLVHTFNSKTSGSEAAESVSLSQFILERHKRSPHHPRLHNESQSQTNKQTKNVLMAYSDNKMQKSNTDLKC